VDDRQVGDILWIGEHGRHRERTQRRKLDFRRIEEQPELGWEDAPGELLERHAGVEVRRLSDGHDEHGRVGQPDRAAQCHIAWTYIPPSNDWSAKEEKMMP